MNAYEPSCGLRKTGAAEADRPNELRDHVERFLGERSSTALATQGPEGLWMASVDFAGDLDAL